MSDHEGSPEAPRRAGVIGVILAGGAGQRIGGSKAIVELAGVPLIHYPLSALRAVLADVAVIAKADTVLPDLPGVAVWIESRPERHPLTGIVEALALAGGRPVLVCAVDLPFVSHELIGRLADADPRPAPAVVAALAGAMQPLLGRYEPAAAVALSQAARRGVSAREAVAALDPALLEVEDPDLLFNVNAPEDLLRAAAILDGPAKRPTRT